MFQPARKARRFWKVNLWGGFKAGKTRGMLSFPGLAVIDGDRGSVLYADKYPFDVLDANHWPELLNTLTYLESGNHSYKTLGIDPLTIYWQDLLDQQVQYTLNRRNSEVLTSGDWGMIKRRYKGLMNRLMDLNMNVVLSSRSKDEYENITDPRTGEDKTRKTGDQIADVEKSTDYFFDVILHLYTVEDKKKGVCQHFARVDGSRVDEIPKYKVYDITKKRLYDVIFKPLEAKYQSGEPLPPREQIPAQPVMAVPAPPPFTGTATVPAPAHPPHATAVGDISMKFAGAQGEDPPATAEDIKVLMTRAGQLTWPDGRKFTSAEGKTLIKSLYKVDSTKDLKKFQVNYLYDEFGKVLSGKAHLALDEGGIPFVATHSEVETTF